MISEFLREESGATAVEYGLIVSLIVVAIIVAVEQFGLTIGGLYEGVKDEVTAVMP